MSKPSKSDPHPLAPLMERTRRDPFFLGFALDEYARRSGWDDEQLALYLKCALQRLPHLFLCRSPDANDPLFAQHVRSIAEYVPCDEMQLLLVLREQAALAKFSDRSSSMANPFFLAARDRQDTQSTDQTDENQPADEDRGS